MGILMCAGDKPAASIISLNRCSSVMPAGQPTHATSLSPGQRPEVAVSPPELQFTDGEQLLDAKAPGVLPVAQRPTARQKKKSPE